jgi:hypothetical protein
VELGDIRRRNVSSNNALTSNENLDSSQTLPDRSMILFGNTHRKNENCGPRHL